MNTSAMLAQFNKALSWLVHSDHFNEFAKAFCTALGSAAAAGVIAIFTDLIARSRGLSADNLSIEEKKLIKRYSPQLYRIMMSNYSFVSRLIAKIRFTGTGGIIIIGPSGAGKSSLRDILSVGHTHDSASTKK